MPRERRSAEEIRDEVARLLNEGRKFPLHVPLPLKLLDTDDPFEGAGSNWRMPKFRPRDLDKNAAAIGRAILNVKSRWDLI
jgi:hypothetical protein